MSLAASLKELSDNINNLILDCDDANTIKQLEAQLKDVLAQRSKLVEASMNSATQEYIAATAGVEKANGDVKAALGDLAKIAKAIKTTATALNYVGKAIAKI